jgi:hypothetical protein
MKNMVRVSKKNQEQKDAETMNADINSANTAPVTQPEVAEPLSEDEILGLFEEAESQTRTRGDSVAPAHVIREKFIKPIFESSKTTGKLTELFGMERIPVGVMTRTVNKAFKLEGDDRIQNQAVRGAAGKHFFATTNNVTYIYSYMVSDKGQKLSDLEVAEINSRKRLDKDTEAAIKDIVDNEDLTALE